MGHMSFVGLVPFAGFVKLCSTATRNHMTIIPALRHLHCLILALIVLATSASLYAEESPTLPPWLTLSLTKKILDIDMDEEQRTLFRASLTECLEGIRADVTKIMRRGGANLPKKMQRASKNRFSEFETKMLDALNPEQHDAFKIYLAEQIEVLQDMRR